MFPVQNTLREGRPTRVMDNNHNPGENGPVESTEKRESSIRSIDDEFGGREGRQRLERKLLWKLDCRMLILVIIYILNFASGSFIGNSYEH